MSAAGGNSGTEGQSTVAISEHGRSDNRAQTSRRARGSDAHQASQVCSVWPRSSKKSARAKLQREPEESECRQSGRCRSMRSQSRVKSYNALDTQEHAHPSTASLQSSKDGAAS